MISNIAINVWYQLWIVKIQIWLWQANPKKSNKIETSLKASNLEIYLPSNLFQRSKQKNTQYQIEMKDI